MKYLILTEKPSARRNFEKALGGATGTFNGYEFELTNLRGHVMTLKEPEEMVAKELVEQYKTWKMAGLPWDIADFNWQYTYIKSKNPRTNKMESTKQLLDDLKKKASTGFDGIIIATDTDPSGEGELLAWEAILTIGWNKTVLRANFMDESEKSIKAALSKVRDVSDFTADGEFAKGFARNRWDFLSMQLTRIATITARDNGYNVVARQGRLKSAMIWHIFEQLQAIKAYVKKPFYEVRFADDGKHIYKRAVEDVDNVAFRFDQETDGQNDLTHYHESPVTNVVTTKKRQAPPKLLDLSSLSAILAKDGYEAKEVLDTYQNMYESQIVSYPRTEDKTITPEQFSDLLPFVDQIASLISIDLGLLTHREPRKTHVKEQGAHGANRPGAVIPKSLAELKKYGPSAQAIYTTLAQNYLAMLGEDYEYNQVTAELQEYPDFKTSYTVPVNLNWKLIYQDDDQETSEDDVNVIGTVAAPFLFEGANSKPTQPTWKWLKTFLEKYDIGTGATRTSTYAELSSGKNAYIKDTKGKINLTSAGKVSAYLVKGTFIADPKITKRVFDLFDGVRKFTISDDEALDSATKTIRNDMPIIIENGKSLIAAVGEPSGDMLVKSKSDFVEKEKASGEWHGKTIQFNKEFGGHVFSDYEVEELLAGREIEFDAISKKGKSFTARGSLKEKEFKGKQFVGFEPNFN